MKTVSIKVVSAIKLTKSQLDQIKKSVESKFKSTKLSLDTEVNKSVIGGIKLIINAVEYDATVQGKLDKLRSHLTEKL